MEKTTDVLIVGAGPSGLMAANELTRRGIDCTVIEKRAAPSKHSKALGIQARTLEVLDQAGIAERFVLRGYPAPGAKFHLGGGAPAKMEFFRLETRFPYLLILPQSETEEMLEEHLLRQGGFVERECEWTGLTMEEDGVVASVTQNGTEGRIDARYLLACDGAHSRVRESLQVPFPGEGENITFFLGDIRAEGLDPMYLNIHLTDRGVVAFFPFKEGHFRIVSVDFSKQDRPHRDELPLAELQDTVDRIVPGIRLTDPVWLTQFGTSHRQVPSYRSARVFFIGDAAHVHNPLGGQGMNLGLQDASNLAWKMALVLSDRAHPDILNTYDEERRPIGGQILAATNRALQTVTAKPPWSAVCNWLGKGALSSRTVQKRLTENLANIVFDYRFSELAKRHRDPGLESAALQAGDRVPELEFLGVDRINVRLVELLRQHSFPCFIYAAEPDASFIAEANACAGHMKQRFGNLVSPYLVVKGGVPGMYGNRLPVLFDATRQVESRLGMKNGHLLMIRPDGHVAFHQKTADPEQVSKKMSGWLQPRN